MRGFKNLDKILKNNWKLKLFFLKVLPIGVVTGLRVETINEEEVSVSVPYKYVNKNPFGSIYFAVESMAAELSTAIPALIAVSRAQVPVSMLVVKMEAQFTKKAKDRAIFTCRDLDLIQQTVDEAIKTGQGRTVTVKTVGIDKQGQQVATFTFTWSFKAKTKT